MKFSGDKKRIEELKIILLKLTGITVYANIRSKNCSCESFLVIIGTIEKNLISKSQTLCKKVKKFTLRVYDNDAVKIPLLIEFLV